jgi:hypothetical protein
MNPSKVNNRVNNMKAAYEQAKAQFLANRNNMTDKELNQARDNLNAMHKEMQTAECVAKFEDGASVDVQMFLSLLKHYNIQYTNSFNEWVQGDVVTVSKTGYESYKISKAKAKELLSYVAQLTEAVDMPKLIEEVIAQQTEEHQEAIQQRANTLSYKEIMNGKVLSTKRFELDGSQYRIDTVEYKTFTYLIEKKDGELVSIAKEILSKTEFL